MTAGLRWRSPKLLLTALTATLLLSLATASASARRFNLSDSTFKITWGEFIARSTGNFAVTCQVTIEGSFHSRSFTKVSGLLIGHVTSMKVRTPICEGGVFRPLTETLPWHVQYNRFEGALPSISHIAIAIVGASIGVTNLSSSTCLIRTTQAQPLLINFEISAAFPGAIEIGQILTEHTISGSGAPLCEFIEPWRLEGNGRMLTQANSQLRLRLIQ